MARSLSMEGRKGLVRDAFDAFATYCSLGHDVTETNSWIQNGSTHQKSIEKRLYVFLVIYNYIKLDSY